MGARAHGGLCSNQADPNRSACWSFPPPGATNPMDRIATLVTIGRKCVWIPHLGRHPDAPSGCCNTLWGLGPAGRGTVTNSNLTMGALDKDPNVVTARDGTWGVCVASLCGGQGMPGHGSPASSLDRGLGGMWGCPLAGVGSSLAPWVIPNPPSPLGKYLSQLILHKLSRPLVFPEKAAF